MVGCYKAYSFEDSIFLRSVLDEAIGLLPAGQRTRAARSKIARQMMQCAATGERSRVELRMAGLAEFDRFGDVTACGA
jgi:hypothetical protein